MVKCQGPGCRREGETTCKCNWSLRLCGQHSISHNKSQGDHEQFYIDNLLDDWIDSCIKKLKNLDKCGSIAFHNLKNMIQIVIDKTCLFTKLIQHLYLKRSTAIRNNTISKLEKFAKISIFEGSFDELKNFNDIFRKYWRSIVNKGYYQEEDDSYSYKFQSMPPQNLQDGVALLDKDENLLKTCYGKLNELDTFKTVTLLNSKIIIKIIINNISFLKQRIEQDRSAIIQAIRNQDLSSLKAVMDSETDAKIFQEKVNNFSDILDRVFHLKLAIDEIDWKKIRNYKESDELKNERKIKNLETIVYANGDIYEGEWKNDLREGRGVLKFSNGDFYEGEWKNDLREGRGVLKFSNGDNYEGEWKNNFREGKGVLKFSNGDKYDGEWKKDLREGSGMLRFSNGDLYDGEWKNDLREGSGMFRNSDWDIYDGEWKNDLREGRGVLKLSNGDKYEGSRAKILTPWCHLSKAFSIHYDCKFIEIVKWTGIH